MLDRERKDHGPDYHDHGVLFCWEDGTPPHPDTITRRFKQLAAAAGLPEIDLHDVRHSYATAGRDAKIDWKALSRRIGHADVAFTMKQYVQTDLEADRGSPPSGSVQPGPPSLIGPWGTAPDGGELQPKLQPGPSAPLELSRFSISPRPRIRLTSALRLTHVTLLIRATRGG